MYITVISLIILVIICLLAPKSEETTDYDHDINHDTIIQKGE